MQTRWMPSRGEGWVGASCPLPRHLLACPAPHCDKVEEAHVRGTLSRARLSERETNRYRSRPSGPICVLGGNLNCSGSS